jgi:hypothetical protein
VNLLFCESNFESDARLDDTAPAKSGTRSHLRELVFRVRAWNQDEHEDQVVYVDKTGARFFSPVIF